ncbi:hypothetical protein F9288_19610 [Sphingomonas sp. CL5.1]|uniref:hypothetical protein n=1 Tax=Sphingomonas sp. CL5.1 TaxID=2653203 RepID=UPI0015832441|nr:hypothetical protein [Sphingomonas sp. CL5.1]QKS01579.1 hypothetical protein F9288_19610 [Sphingomonas sp. CL5.1]
MSEGTARGWRAPWAIYVVASFLAAVAIASALLLGEDPAERALLAARYTARVSFLAFTIVFIAGPASRLWHGPAVHWLARSRRHLGLATALLLFIHLAALLINITIYHPRPWKAQVGGAIIYLLLAAMALTSSNDAQRWMGRWWRRVHLLGLSGLWLAFFAAYAGRLLAREQFLTGLIFTPVVLLILAVRLYALARRRVTAPSR